MKVLGFAYTINSFRRAQRRSGWLAKRPLSGAWVSMDAKPISSLAKLWQRLACYRDSLETDDPNRYCREKSALFNTLVGCEEHRCPVPCQLIW